MKSGENKLLILIILCSVFVLSSFSFLSATSAGVGIAPETVITGTVYNNDNGQPVPGAEITIKCNMAFEKTKTDANGVYYFDLLKKKCGKNNEATVLASMDGISGFNTKKITGKNTLINVLLGEEGEKTIVTGIIYGSDLQHTINGANVKVSCNGNEKTTTSKSDGVYFVLYDDSKCKEGDTATVDATKDDLSGSNTGVVHDGILGFLDVAVINVPLVPEFGVVAGTLTVLGAVTTFFFIRKKQHIRIKRKL